jgi:hypothetical protein
MAPDHQLIVFIEVGISRKDFSKEIYADLNARPAKSAGQK